MAQRTGVFTMLKVSKRLCQLILAFEPVIRRVYPENTAVITALNAAMVACEALRVQLEPLYQIVD